MFSEKPYKVLKQVNESDIVDISNQDIVNETLITSNIEKVLDYIK